MVGANDDMSGAQMVSMMDYVYVQYMSNMRLEMLMAADCLLIGGHVRCVDSFYDGLCLDATNWKYEAGILLTADGRLIGGHVRHVNGFYDRVYLRATHWK